MSDFTGADALGTDPDMVVGTPPTEIPDESTDEDTADEPDVLEQPDTAPLEDPDAR
ncbi:hypothetical protein SAMN06295909_0802 [Plantibacter sp. VKM Ac-1784]|uniref:Uncharacterized protein n=1 Tax=Plantibacter elymi (nom. nud.) TaxID=199708 RepID=A0ABY1R9G7_9MICO|nr:hypothetical protein [Plantibacter sp. VKM Ac-1784]SMQ62891.1 hypothetical protein SAMN06295909_0802 [Plantibacter sp. VKM Ac-1784]